jgi:methylmalonyl-CoA mutase N-terminal domain/subunit
MTLERLKVDPAIEIGQRERLAALRANRDSAKVTELLSRLEKLARGTPALRGAEESNLLPLFIECVENDITLGEICNTLRSVWGEYVAQGF